MAELHLTQTQALHLLMNRHLHLLTTRGDQTLQDELTTTLAELEALGPTPDVDI